MSNQEGFRGPKQWQGFERQNWKALKANRIDAGNKEGILDAAERVNQRLAADARQVFERIQVVNAGLIEGRFAEFRSAANDWSIDTFLIDEDGVLMEDSEPWSTIRDAEQGIMPAPSLDEIVSRSASEEKWVIPITPVQDTALFWLGQHSDAVIETIYKGEKISVTVFDHADGAAEGYLNKVIMARARKDKVLPAEFGRQGVNVGRLGFWHRPSSHPTRLIPRVSVDPKSEALGSGTIMVSSISEADVEKYGLTPMDKKHPGVRVVRTEGGLGVDEFITASLKAFSKNFSDEPFVLRYITPRAWLGEGPKPHGGGS